MARRKTGRYHMRTDPDNRKLWQTCAEERGMSLASWIEANCNLEVLRRERERQLAVMYPQSHRDPVEAHRSASKTWERPAKP